MEIHGAHLARSHGQLRTLHAHFAQVTAAFEAGRLTLGEEVILHRDIIRATAAAVIGWPCS